MKKLIFIITTIIILSGCSTKDTKKSATQINKEIADECVANGFDYEFVNDFWYIGVRCKKLSN